MWPVFRGKSLYFVSRLWVKFGVRHHSFNWGHVILDIRGFSDSVLSTFGSLDDIDERKSRPSWLKQRKETIQIIQLYHTYGYPFAVLTNKNAALRYNFPLSKLFHTSFDGYSPSFDWLRDCFVICKETALNNSFLLRSILSCKLSYTLLHSTPMEFYHDRHLPTQNALLTLSSLYWKGCVTKFVDKRIIDLGYGIIAPKREKN